MSDKIEVNRRRVLGGLITIGAAGAAVGAGTFAAFSDSGQSTGNTIQAGTLSLENTSGTVINATNVAPGWGPNTYTITTDYASSSTIDPVNLTLDIGLSENDLSSDSSNDLDAAQFGQKIEVTTATIEDSGGDSTDLLAGISTRTTGHPGSQSYKDLDQVAGSYADTLTNVSPGETVTLTLELQMPSAVGNTAQGEGADIGVTFTASQS